MAGYAHRIRNHVMEDVPGALGTVFNDQAASAQAVRRHGEGVDPGDHGSAALSP